MTKNKTGYSRIPMKFSLDYCKHRPSQAGLGASDSLIIPNGRMMDKNCLRPVCPSSDQDTETNRSNFPGLS